MLLARQAGMIATSYSKAVQNSPAFSLDTPPNALAFVQVLFQSGLTKDPVMFDFSVTEARDIPEDDWYTIKEVFDDPEFQQIEKALYEADEIGKSITPQFITYLLHIWLGHVDVGGRDKTEHWTKTPFSLRDELTSFNFKGEADSEDWSHEVIYLVFKRFGSP